MNAYKTASRVAGVIALTAIGLVAWQSHQIRQIQNLIDRERADFRTQHAGLESRIAELESREPATAARTDAAEVASQVGQLQQEKLAEERSRQQALARQRAQEAKGRASAMRQFQFSREMQQEHFRQFKAELPARYRPLYRMLGLSSDQVARFEELMAERYWAYSDLLATRDAQGPDFDEQVYAEMTQQVLASFDEGLRTLAGEPAVEHYRHYERMAQAQGLIQSIASRLFDTSEPLSATQADQLLIIFATPRTATHEQSPGETWLRARISGGESKASIQWTDLDWNAAQRKLDGLLSPQQFAAVQALREQAQARQQAKFLQDEFEQEMRAKQNAVPAGTPR